MNPQLLVESVRSYLDSLQSIVSAGLVIALLTYWSGLLRTPAIEIFGLKVNRRYATFVVGIAFLGLQIAFLATALRLDDVARRLDDRSYLDALTVATSHPWILNPFAYAGPQFFPRAATSFGFSGLIVTWWFCATALYLISDIPPDGTPRPSKHLSARIYAASGAVFFFLGTLSMWAIGEVFEHVSARPTGGLKSLDLEPTFRRLQEQFAAVSGERNAMNLLGIGAGFLLFVTSRRIKNRRDNRARVRQATQPSEATLSAGH